MKFLFIPFFICCCITCSAQTETMSKDSIYAAFKQIASEVISEKNYTRIPVQDLDERLNSKISDEVGTRLKGAIAIIGSVLGILIAIFGGILASRQRDRFKGLNAELKKEIIDDLRPEISKEVELFYLKNYEKKMNELRENVNTEIKRVTAALDSINVQIPDIRKSFVQTRVESIFSDRTNNRLTDHHFAELKDLLADAEELKDNILISKVLNELTYVSFYLRKDRELEPIMSNYIERADLDIEATAYINTAVVTLYAYQATGDNNEKEKALKYINQALKKIPDYGEAFALKIELLMSIYDKTVDANEKEKLKEETAVLIKLINRSKIAAKETLARFDRIQASKAKSIYIVMALTMFPDEFEEMKKIGSGEEPAD